MGRGTSPGRRARASKGGVGQKRETRCHSPSSRILSALLSEIPLIVISCFLGVNATLSTVLDGTSFVGRQGQRDVLLWGRSGGGDHGEGRDGLETRFLELLAVGLRDAVLLLDDSISQSQRVLRQEDGSELEEAGSVRGEREVGRTVSLVTRSGPRISSSPCSPSPSKSSWGLGWSEDSVCWVWVILWFEWRVSGGKRSQARRVRLSPRSRRVTPALLRPCKPPLASDSLLSPSLLSISTDLLILLLNTPAGSAGASSGY